MGHQFDGRSRPSRWVGDEYRVLKTTVKPPVGELDKWHERSSTQKPLPLVNPPPVRGRPLASRRIWPRSPRRCMPRPTDCCSAAPTTCAIACMSFTLSRDLSEMRNLFAVRGFNLSTNPVGRRWGNCGPACKTAFAEFRGVLEFVRLDLSLCCLDALSPQWLVERCCVLFWRENR